MAGFGRSNSLSINTGSTLFGNNATSGGQQSAGLFGSSTAASQPATAGGLFGSTSQSQTGGLFGGGAPAATTQPPQSTSQPQSAGLFGSLNKPAAAAGGLFGSSTTQLQPPQSASLFGGALGGTQTQTQQPASQSGGLFTLGQPPKPSLFGASTQQTTMPSLFGNTNTQQNQPSAPSLFGASQQNQPQQNTMFNQNRAFSLGGSVSAPNLGASQSGVQHQAMDNVKGTTRFSDLHPDLQNTIQVVDKRIQDRITMANSIRETLPQQGEKVATLAPDVAYIEESLSTVELGIDNDSANISHLKELVRKDADDAALSFRAIINLKLPNQFHYGNRTNLNASTIKPTPNPSTSLDDSSDASQPVDLMGYFQTRTDDLARTLDLYENQIREIEAHLRTMEAGTLEKAQQLTGSRNGPRDQRRELIEALKAIEGAILDSAKKVGQVRDAVTKETLGSVGAALL